MERDLTKAKEDMLESWFVFSQTGDIQDARMLIDSIREYDLLLAEEYNATSTAESEVLVDEESDLELQ